MPRRKAETAIGQVDVFGAIHGLDKLVQPPDVIESEGLKVIHFAVSEEDRIIPGYMDEVKEQARKLSPEVQSTSKPPWMRAEWQAKRRKQRESG